MPWTDRITFLDKARNQLVMTKIVGPHSDSESSSSPCEHLPTHADSRRLPLDRNSKDSVLDHGDDAMSNDFAWALGLDMSGVYDEEEEPVKVNCEKLRPQGSETLRRQGRSG